MFSDILTPLPALGCALLGAHTCLRSNSAACFLRSIEFDVVSGKGPVIPVPIRSMEQVASLRPMEARSCGACRATRR